MIFYGGWLVLCCWPISKDLFRKYFFIFAFNLFSISRWSRVHLLSYHNSNQWIKNLVRSSVLNNIADFIFRSFKLFFAFLTGSGSLFLFNTSYYLVINSFWLISLAQRIWLSLSFLIHSLTPLYYLRDSYFYWLFFVKCI